MIEFFFAREPRVLMARISGIYDIDDMTRFDTFVTQFVARNGEVRALYDFTGVESVAVPMRRLEERARQPSLVGGLRVIVAPPVIGVGMTRTFTERQSEAGHAAPIVVGKLEEAYALLGLHYKAAFLLVEDTELR
jgi:hypothetical protein